MVKANNINLQGDTRGHSSNRVRNSLSLSLSLSLSRLRAIINRVNKRHYSAGSSYAFSAGAVMLFMVAMLGGGRVVALSYQNSQDVTFTFEPTVAMTISGDLVIDDLTPGSGADSNIIDITAGTNSMGGYVLYATVGNDASGVPSHNSTSLVHSNNSDAFTSISTTTALADFDVTSGGKWGYSYCIATNDCDSSTYWVSGDYDNSPATGYNGLPLYTAATGVKLSETNNQAGTSSLKFKIGAKASSNQTSGVYTNEINFIGITKMLITSYTISYNDVLGSDSGLPASQSGEIITDVAVALSASMPSRSGYNFVGWCTEDNTADPTACSGTVYSAGDTYMVPNAGGTLAIPLYAVWGRNTYNVTVNFAGTGVTSVTLANATYGNTVVNTSGSTAVLRYGVSYEISGTYSAGYEFGSWATAANGVLGSTSSATTTYSVSGVSTLTLTGKSSKAYMQNVTSSTLATMMPSVGSTATLYDARDEQAYTVAKLADGKYWMVENLNLAGGTALSPDDTNVTSAYISSFSTGNNLTKSGNTIVLPASSTSGFNTNNYSYVYNSGRKTPCTSPGCYSYYSWDAATLGSGRSISADNTDAQQSICPKGWRLPKSRTTSAANWQTVSDFYALAHQYGLDSTTSTSESDNGFYTQAGPGTTPNFLLAGYYGSGSFGNGGSGGYYWSSTSYSSSRYARFLYFDSGSVGSANGHYRNYGLSVRCLFGS